MKKTLLALLALVFFATPVVAASVTREPIQNQWVFPGEDAWTPAFDSEGCVPLGAQDNVLAFGPNETQAMSQFNFSGIFRRQAARSSTGESITFISLVKDRKNPLSYNVKARVSQNGHAFNMCGALTLVKAASFDNSTATSYKNVATGQKVERVNNEVRNGFVSGDLVLSSGKNKFKGIITAYFCWRFDWEKQKLGVAYFNYPTQFIKGFQNPYFSGEWK